MELPAFSIVDDDELMEEALAILDSVDIERLGASDSSATLFLQEVPSESAVADHLLETAVQAVQEVFSQNGCSDSTKASTADKSGQLHGNQENGVVSSDHDALRVLPVASTTGNATPRSRRRGGGRMRMREQLIQLRSVVQKMESHLETLKSPRSPRLSIRAESFEDVETATNLPAENDDANVSGPASEVTDEATVWRNIAMQQFRARRLAEQQNAELRENLGAQLQLSKQVENLLQAQQPRSNSLVVEDPSSSSKPEGDTKAEAASNKGNKDYTF
ncbi:hypothetical protein KRP22_009846 [Phytophthora ramorum]|uniref:uncharacterized protein n=1 Tax=Phytophthora ramorum TaxID=164328 RepID=UPI00309886A5|nr:hypothetical protein KRP23_5329 [Phytophthora ramorum]KAH7495640.1 hypothetical protein KRP22_14792 [Phytophthora ramorum]